MRCLECGSEAVTERPERTAQGDRRFCCRTSSKQFNERSGGCPRSAARFCHAHDELRHVLRPHSRAPINMCPPMAADWSTSGGP